MTMPDSVFNQQIYGNFIQKRLQHKCFFMNIAEEHLRTAASIRCYFKTINLKQSGFCTTYYFKIPVSEQKY